MRRSFLSVSMIAAMSLAVAAMAGCGTQSETGKSVNTEKTTYADSTEKSTDVKSSVLDKIDGQSFYYSSGAGAWATELKVHADGTFEGHYYDMDRGDSGIKNPNGTQYDCQFNGRFSTPKKADDYSYTMKVEKLETDKKDGTDEIKDGIKYVYTMPAGISDGANLYIYIPGTPVSKLPEGYLNWASMSLNGADQLSFYGIYNENDEAGFVGETKSDTSSGKTSISKSSIQEELAQIESKASEINVKLQNENLTQTDMNRLTADIYKLWDDELNKVWSHLKDTLDNSTMSKLKEEERSWIKEKDSKVEAAGKEASGGSMQTMLENDKAAELTRARVYELVKYY